MKVRDLTPAELKYCDRDILASWLEAIQKERAELLAQVTAGRAVDLTPAVIKAYIDAPDEDDGDILGPLRAAFRAAGCTVAGDPS
jgi:hypothetical protein